VQDNTGLTGILSNSYIYEQLQNLVGARRAQKWLADHYWKVGAGQKIVDVGCGLGATLANLRRDITYIGFDISKDYIAAAQQRFDTRATFIVSTAEQLLDTPDPRLTDSDLVLCNGILHHLNDEEVIHVLKLAKQILTDNGRLVCFEPTFLAHQGFLSEWLMRKDRGKNIRLEGEWKQLTGTVFKSVQTSIATNLYWVPYIHIIIECRNTLTANELAEDAAH
jgi:ubiquinone/menaquinone biosynthesis C-methylase UbiE